MAATTFAIPRASQVKGVDHVSVVEDGEARSKARRVLRASRARRETRVCAGSCGGQPRGNTAAVSSFRVLWRGRPRERSSVGRATSGLEEFCDLLFGRFFSVI
ncbi:hypothetical protein NL676_005888 [Syzygium grande]|nr:hypothetical protein NL676_005888 [Syzygium grande]